MSGFQVQGVAKEWDENFVPGLMKNGEQLIENLSQKTIFLATVTRLSSNLTKIPSLTSIGFIQQRAEFIIHWYYWYWMSLLNMSIQDLKWPLQTLNKNNNYIHLHQIKKHFFLSYPGCPGNRSPSPYPNGPTGGALSRKIAHISEKCWCIIYRSQCTAVTAQRLVYMHVWSHSATDSYKYTCNHRNFSYKLCSSVFVLQNKVWYT